jgi:hypothetical protein
VPFPQNFGRFGDWGIYKASSYEVALPCSSITSFDVKREWAVADYPVEGDPTVAISQGYASGFESYDKVATPYEVRLQMIQMGSVADRNTFLQKLDQMAGDLVLYHVITPDIIYLNANILRYDYRRTATNGLTMIIANVQLREIRVATPTNFSPTAMPSGAQLANGGITQLTPQGQVPITSQAALNALLVPNATRINPLLGSISASVTGPLGV